MYKLTQNSNVIRLADGAFIHTQCEEYLGYLRWLDEGNTPEPADQPSPQDAIKAQIAALEATVTPRRVREAVLGTDNGWLADVDGQIAVLRAQL